MWVVEGSSKSEFLKQTNRIAVKFDVDEIQIKEETLMRKESSIKGEETWQGLRTDCLAGITDPTVWPPQQDTGVLALGWGYSGMTGTLSTTVL